MMDIRKANMLTNEWKQRLGLLDWVIFLRINCDDSDLVIENPEENAGEIEWTYSCKSAVIRIKDLSEANDFIVPLDFEKTLVHELLHLKFALVEEMCTTKAEYVHMHQLIDDMARAMVDAKRNKIDRDYSGSMYVDKKECDQ